MERMLLKLAKQLDGFDEASLMDLWDKYQAIVQDFQPSKHWEEAVLVFGMIQAVRWKNQLFNYHWSRQQSGEEEPPGVQPEEPGETNASGDFRTDQGKVLTFKPKKKE